MYLFAFGNNNLSRNFDFDFAYAASVVADFTSNSDVDGAYFTSISDGGVASGSACTMSLFLPLEIII